MGRNISFLIIHYHNKAATQNKIQPCFIFSRDNSTQGYPPKLLTMEINITLGDGNAASHENAMVKGRGRGMGNVENAGRGPGSLVEWCKVVLLSHLWPSLLLVCLKQKIIKLINFCT